MPCPCSDLTLKWQLGSSDGKPVMEIFDVTCTKCGATFLFQVAPAGHVVSGVSNDREGVILGLERQTVN
jgi:hypothetical protein